MLLQAEPALYLSQLGYASLCLASLCGHNYIEEIMVMFTESETIEDAKLLLHSQVKKSQSVFQDTLSKLQEVSDAQYFGLLYFCVSKSFVCHASAVLDLIDNRRITSIKALSRILLDTLARLNGFFMVENIDEAAEMFLFKIERFNELKSRDGKKMVDSYLMEELDKYMVDAKISDRYKHYCQYVHFTNKQVIDADIKHDADDNSIEFEFSAREDYLEEQKICDVLDFVRFILLAGTIRLDMLSIIFQKN
jgi:hypothetical protein